MGLNKQTVKTIDSFGPVNPDFQDGKQNRQADAYARAVQKLLRHFPPTSFKK
jgi:hypothetical protein